ncbi:trimeric intracellular cation channel family protein [Qipengyuania soli]|uniref:Trimeric intracellular cation channel family protein n=1 Tax=Qipengyuania soli TaxID=2782568 RepID=A0A7S8ITV9_9SPHN|nr:trimeric intracellular cation channel family protein [Qipengyuania soli]QPC97787.1 trimeric intracellular cation channel family protein [Qipengyuania soli]
MNSEVLTPVLDWLDLAGVAIFALTGALVAAREKQTMVTLSFFALVTGVGGGTIRDLLIGAPVFWIHDAWVAAICLGVALFAWFTPTRWWEGTFLSIADGLGLAAYAVLGTAKALEYGVPHIPALLMGIITGCAGGIIRDVIAGRPSILMKPELYVTAAALSASVTVLGETIGIPRELTWVLATGAGFGLRLAAIRWKLALPAYGRD